MESIDLHNRLERSTQKLIEFAQGQVTNALASRVEYVVYPNRAEDSPHLNDTERAQLAKLLTVAGTTLSAEQVTALLLVSGHAPVWINSQIHRSTKDRTLVSLQISRRLRTEEHMNAVVDEWPPFHPVVALPPWHKEGVKFNVNWQHHMWKRRWHALVWRWRNGRRSDVSTTQ
jgi:hypothetical protein